VTSFEIPQTHFAVAMTYFANPHTHFAVAVTEFAAEVSGSATEVSQLAAEVDALEIQVTGIAAEVRAPETQMEEFAIPVAWALCQSTATALSFNKLAWRSHCAQPNERSSPLGPPASRRLLFPSSMQDRKNASVYDTGDAPRQAAAYR
jgi:outer membrane murein-binding lipoprotein Lpp